MVRLFTYQPTGTTLYCLVSEANACKPLGPSQIK